MITAIAIPTKTVQGGFITQNEFVKIKSKFNMFGVIDNADYKDLTEYVIVLQSGDFKILCNSHFRGFRKIVPISDILDGTAFM